jgi:hypothetical protein
MKTHTWARLCMCIRPHMNAHATHISTCMAAYTRRKYIETYGDIVCWLDIEGGLSKNRGNRACSHLCLLSCRCCSCCKCLYTRLARAPAPSSWSYMSSRMSELDGHDLRFTRSEAHFRLRICRPGSNGDRHRQRLRRGCLSV